MYAGIHTLTKYTPTPPITTTTAIFFLNHLTEGNIYFGSWFEFSLWSAGSTAPMAGRNLLVEGHSGGRLPTL